MKKISPSFVVLFAIFVFCNISAMEGLRQEEDEKSNDGVEFAQKHPLPLRERRKVKNNATPNLPDILKRLHAVEKK